MEVNMKCKGCNTFKDFVLYKDRASFALHLVCHENKHCHYDKVPFMKIIGRMNILERDRRMRSIIFLFFISICILVLFMCLFKLWFAVFMLFAIFLMLEYVFIQLHIDDICAVRVFEMSFNNETKQNLQNIGIANCNNRTYEIMRKPTYKIIYQKLHGSNRDIPIVDFLIRITFIRFVIALIALIHRNKVRYDFLRKYLLRIPEMYDELNNDICQRQEVLDVIKTKKEEFEGISLKVLGIEYVDKPLHYRYFNMGLHMTKRIKRSNIQSSDTMNLEEINDN